MTWDKFKDTNNKDDKLTLNQKAGLFYYFNLGILKAVLVFAAAAIFLSFVFRSCDAPKVAENTKANTVAQIEQTANQTGTQTANENTTRN